MIKNPESGADIVNSMVFNPYREGYRDSRFGPSRVVTAGPISFARLDLLYDVKGEVYIPAQQSRVYVHPEVGFATGLDIKVRRPWHFPVPGDWYDQRWVISEEVASPESVAESVYALAYPSKFPSVEYPGPLITSGLKHQAAARAALRMSFDN